MFVSFISKFRNFAVGVLFGLISCIVTVFLFSLIFSFTPVSETYIPLISVFVIAVSAFINGFVSVRLIDNAGLINGFISGIIFCVMFFSLSIILGNNSLEISKLLYYIICIVLSTLGGITAINHK